MKSAGTFPYAPKLRAVSLARTIIIVAACFIIWVGVSAAIFGNLCAGIAS